VIPESIPSFATVKDFQFMLAPQSLLDIGTHLVKFRLTYNFTKDSYSTFSFQVTVLNSPPFFKTKLSNLRVPLGSVQDYMLPEMGDRENLKVQLSISPDHLPKFITLSN
jgi:hypothetical protein